MDRVRYDASSGGLENEIVTLLVRTGSSRVAVFDSPAADTTSVLRSVLDNATVSSHFSERRLFLSCRDLSSSEIVWSRIAAELGLEKPDSNNAEAIIADVMENLSAHKNTLIIIDELDIIYSSEDPEQQEATDVLLAVLAAIDEVTLLISFDGHSLPNIVHWTQVNYPNDVRNLAGGSGSVSLTKEGVHADQPPGPLTIASSRIPPPKPSVFYGRDKEVERLVEQALVPNSPPLGIVGPGGIGKTTLALKVLHDPRIHERFSTHRVFVSCEGATGTDDVLGRVALKIGAKPSEGTPIWSTVLATLSANERTFLVLDNFETIWSPTDQTMREAAEIFLAQLAVLEEITILVTTRGNTLPEDFAWANSETAELETLSPTAARQRTTKLLKEVDFMPLAVTLLARLDDLPSRLLREWLEHFTDVLEADYHDGTRRELSVEVSIKISLAHLPAETTNHRPRELLSVCSQLPAGLFVEVVDQLRPCISNIDTATQSLLRHSLVYTGNWGELRMLSPVRHYVSLSLSMEAATRSVVEEFYLSLRSKIPNTDRLAIDGPTLDREIPNALSIMNTMAHRPTDRLVDAASDLVSYCIVRGHNVSPTFLEKLLLYVGHRPRWRAHCLMTLGRLKIGSYDYDTAMSHFEVAAGLFAELEDVMNELHVRARMNDLHPRMLRLGQGRANWSAQLARTRHLLPQAGMSHMEDVFARDETQSAAEVETRLRHARETCLQAGSLLDATLISNRIATLRKAAGDMSGSIQEFETANALGNQVVAGSTFLGSIKMHLARLYLSIHNYRAAEALISEAHVIFSMQEHQEVFEEALRLISSLREGAPRE